MLARAIERIADVATGDVSSSKFYETAPAGGPSGQDAFLNAAVAIETRLSPHELHAALRAIEVELGRVRGERWGRGSSTWTSSSIRCAEAAGNDAPRTAGNDTPNKPLVIADAELQMPASADGLSPLCAATGRRSGGRDGSSHLRPHRGTVARSLESFAAAGGDSRGNCRSSATLWHRPLPRKRALHASSIRRPIARRRRTTRLAALGPAHYNPWTIPPGSCLSMIGTRQSGS